MTGPALRRLRDDDSLEELTGLLHRAYAPLAAAGLRFVATWQPVETTRRRIERRECFVLEQEGALVGTVTLSPPGAVVFEESPALYRRADVGYFLQLAVEPGLQGHGLGVRLLGAVEERARELGAAWLLLDTSEHAHGLIAWYERRGYREVGRHDWRPHVNYASVVLGRPLRDDAPDLTSPAAPGA